jgi:flagellar basal body-associated protein FliL
MAMQKALIVALTVIVVIAVIAVMGVVTSVLGALAAPRRGRERTAQDFHGSF